MLKTPKQKTEHDSDSTYHYPWSERATVPTITSAQNAHVND